MCFVDHNYNPNIKYCSLTNGVVKHVAKRVFMNFIYDFYPHFIDINIFYQMLCMVGSFN